MSEIKSDTKESAPLKYYKSNVQTNSQVGWKLLDENNNIISEKSYYACFSPLT